MSHGGDGIRGILALVISGLFLAVLTYGLGVFAYSEPTARAFAYLILVLVLVAVLVRILRALEDLR